MESYRKRILEAITSRLFLLFLFVGFLFFILIRRTFELQIVKGETYEKNITATVLRKLSIPAPRGAIYDRFGRPLAENQVTYTIKVDTNVQMENANDVVFELIDVLKKNNDTYLDELPISTARPYTFLFSGSESRERNWKKNILAFDEEKDIEKMNWNAEEIMNYFKNSVFQIDKKYTEEEVREIIALRYAIYAQRYKKYQPIKIAENVSATTVANLEENHEKFPGIYADVDSLRVYPEGEYFSHILGYTRMITDEDYALYKEYGYSDTEIVGKTGLEKSMELDLNGTDGEMLVEVDQYGRTVNVLEDSTIAPVPGKKIYLTIDKDFQKYCFDTLENQLRDVLLDRLNASSSKYRPISLKQLFTSMVTSNNINMEKILQSSEGSEQYKIKMLLEGRGIVYDEKRLAEENYWAELVVQGKSECNNLIENGNISSRQLIFVMEEQNLFSLDEETKSRLSTGKISPLQIINDKLKSLELRPYQTNLDPCTGSLVVADARTGEILAAVTYPSYDNNQLVNHFNYEYYRQLENDPTTPLVNRPFQQRKAPGSTFKMITAIAGLESGVITTRGTIRDLGIFTKAGTPHARCWAYNSGPHGSINVAKAIEVSCNYFFYETVYRMGNVASGNRFDSIETLNYYMEAFGLNKETGVEIGEYAPIMASPKNKEAIVKSRNPDATTTQTRWTDGETIRAAIGQSYNSFTTAHMAKYIGTLANGGTRYRARLIDKISFSNGELLKDFEPEVEHTVDIKKENLKVVFDGMLAVTNGSQGTIRGVFNNYPLQVAAKTGTAQESKNRYDHTWFVGFAPYDNPEIALAVMIPFGEHPKAPAGNIAKNIFSEYFGLNYTSAENNNENILTP